MHVRTAVALTVAVLLLLAACGGSDERTPSAAGVDVGTSATAGDEVNLDEAAVSAPAQQQQADTPGTLARASGGEPDTVAVTLLHLYSADKATPGPAVDIWAHDPSDGTKLLKVAGPVAYGDLVDLDVPDPSFDPVLYLAKAGSPEPDRTGSDPNSIGSVATRLRQDGKRAFVAVFDGHAVGSDPAPLTYQTQDQLRAADASDAGWVLVQNSLPAPLESTSKVVQLDGACLDFSQSNNDSRNATTAGDHQIVLHDVTAADCPTAPAIVSGPFTAEDGKVTLVYVIGESVGSLTLGSTTIDNGA